MNKILSYNVIVSERARQMLIEHVRFVAQKDPKAARKTKRELLKAMRSLSAMPERCPYFIAEYIPANKYHRLYVERNYIVLYKIKEQTVNVEYIVDCRQNYSWLLR